MSANVKQVSTTEVDERLTALVTNSNAIQAICSAVEGTLGPKGLNCMLVDRLGDVTVTNDGSTILQKIDVNHPAAKMLINTAQAQDQEVGDGTTTATVLASALVSEGVKHVAKGVPVTKILEGINLGLEKARAALEQMSIRLKGLNDPLLRKAAFIAGRENTDLAELAVKAGKMLGKQKLLDPGFKLADAVVAKEGAKNEVLLGIVLDKQRMNRQMPKELKDVKVLVVDDALEPEEIEDDALGTEAGFQKYMELRDQFRAGLEKLVALGVGLVLVDKGVGDLAEEVLTDAGAMVIRRVSSKDMAKVVEHTGAKTIKRSSLSKPKEELASLLGFAREVYEDEHLEQIRLLGGKGKPVATIIVGASTQEIKEERGRIARDAASAVQAAVKGGVVPGGGAAELAALRQVEMLRNQTKGMVVYGLDCVVEALKKPFMQIVANAGFNPLEKLGDVIAAQANRGEGSLAVDCNTGEITDMLALGVVDPAPVKLHAIKAAGEIADAVLRINTIIRKKEESRHLTLPAAVPAPSSRAGDAEGLTS
jgi:chaperonin GroEL (HSP60 family)